MSGTITFKAAVDQGRRAVVAQGKANWKLGDIAASVKPEYGDETIQKLADALYLNYNTLLNYRTIAGKYAPEDRTDNSYTVHEKFSKQADRVELVKSKIWTVSEATALVQSRNAPDPAILAEPTPEPAPEPTPELSEIEKTRLHIEQLEGQLKAARAKLAKLEAEETPDAPAPITIGQHTGIRGIPEHAATDNRADCPVCQAGNRDNARPAVKSTRKSAATRKAEKIAANAAKLAA